MITTTSMRQMYAAVLEQDKDAVTRALLEAGVIHFIDIRELPVEWGGRLKEHRPTAGEGKAKELRRRLEGFFRTAGVDPSRIVRVEQGFRKQPEIEKAEEQVEEIASRIRRIRDEQRQAQEEVLRLQEIERRITSHGVDHSRLEGEHSYLRVRFGTVDEDSRAAFERELAAYPSVYIHGDGAQEERVDFLLTLRRDDTKISEILERYGWRRREVPAGIQAAQAEGVGVLSSEKLKEKITELRGRQEQLEKKAKSVVEDREEELSELWAGLRVRELSSKIEQFYRKTEQTYLVSGWIPKEKQTAVTEALMEACGGRCHLEWHDPTDGTDPEVSRKAPVQMHNPKALKPFQMLVENYAVPSYGAVDPTPFVAVFYLAMFGLMFGDVGHGAVVTLVGFLGAAAARRRGKSSMLFPLLAWCGGAAMVAGALFGSYFGMSLLPPIWFDYHGIVVGHGGTGAVESLTDILLITIYFGITVISVGLLLNWINRIRTRDWFGLVWENGGLIVGWIYAAGTYCAFYFVEHDYRQLPDTTALFFLVGVPVLLLAAKPYLEHRRHHAVETGNGAEEAAAKANPVDMVMEWLVEVLEIFSGYLSNTLSFMRVAGLGIAHVSLMVAFFQIADMAATAGGTYTLWSYLILLLGNVLVIGLEGLSAAIQSLRLNYYEFFSKYFSGTGKAYAPISLRSEG